VLVIVLIAEPLKVVVEVEQKGLSCDLSLLDKSRRSGSSNSSKNSSIVLRPASSGPFVFQYSLIEILDGSVLMVVSKSLTKDLKASFVLSWR
jgi:hypothetical protein